MLEAMLFMLCFMICLKKVRNNMFELIVGSAIVLIASYFFEREED
jgi:hypothetical protein